LWWTGDLTADFECFETPWNILEVLVFSRWVNRWKGVWLQNDQSQFNLEIIFFSQKPNSSVVNLRLVGMSVQLTILQNKLNIVSVPLDSISLFTHPLLGFLLFSRKWVWACTDVAIRETYHQNAGTTIDFSAYLKRLMNYL
jgi:hypothetical protein